MLILRVLARESMHGYGIARRLEQPSDDVLQVGESSLYLISRTEQLTSECLTQSARRTCWSSQNSVDRSK